MATAARDLPASHARPTPWIGSELMGAVFGSITAVFIGMSELFGRRVVDRSSVITASVVLSFFGVTVALIAALFFGGEWVGSDMIFGAISGLGMAAGTGFYFMGLERSSATVVAPTVATMTAVLPYTYALVRGEEATGLAILGAAVAFGGLAAIATGTVDLSKLREGLIWGGLSGLGYSTGLAIFIEVSDDSGAWAAVAQRGSSLIVFVIAAVIAGAQLMPPAGVRGDAVASGSFGGLTSVFLLLGLRIDAPATIVTSSMFPLVSVVVGFVLFSDSVSQRQAAGVALALLGIGMVVGA